MPEIPNAAHTEPHELSHNWLVSFSGCLGGERKMAWYRLSAHARNIHIAMQRAQFHRTYMWKSEFLQPQKFLCVCRQPVLGRFFPPSHRWSQNKATDCMIPWSVYTCTYTVNCKHKMFSQAGSNVVGKTTYHCLWHIAMTYQPAHETIRHITMNIPSLSLTRVFRCLEPVRRETRLLWFHFSSQVWAQTSNTS